MNWEKCTWDEIETKGKNLHPYLQSVVKDNDRLIHRVVRSWGTATCLLSLPPSPHLAAGGTALQSSAPPPLALRAGPRGSGHCGRSGG